MKYIEFFQFLTNDAILSTDAAKLLHDIMYQMDSLDNTEFGKFSVWLDSIYQTDIK